MMYYIERGGGFMYLELICLLLVLLYAVKSVIKLYGRQAAPDSGVSIHAVLFWGGISVLVGFLGHYWGLMGAMLFIREVTDIHPGIIADGYSVSLLPVVSGLMILFVAAMLWGWLVSRNRKLMLRGK